MNKNTTTAMKLTKTFKSVNYTKTAGDNYAVWSAGGKFPIDAVLLTVTDESGKAVYSDCIQKGGMFTRTLSDCKYLLNNNYRVFLEGIINNV